MNALPEVLFSCCIVGGAMTFLDRVFRALNLVRARFVVVSEAEWPVGWKGAAEADLDASLRATPAQRLEWLDDAQRFVWRTGAWPKDPESAPSSTEGSRKPCGGD